MSNNWKETLNMPVSQIKMKANLVGKQEEYLKLWKENKIYEKLLARNKNNEESILHDGPPYANGDLHVGHALNKILKDIIVRHKLMQGKYSPFKVGFDTHGLPIENKMLQTLKKSKDDFSILDLRTAAKEYALSQVENQLSQFSKFALISDLKNPYITLNNSYEVSQLKLFQKMIKDDLIFKSLKPVYWSPSSESALAEAEVEYEDHMSPSVHVSFEVTKGNDYISKGDYLVIWTTTPWTLPGNTAIAVNKNINYSLVNFNNKNYLVASELVDNFTSSCKMEDYKIVKEVLGKDLKNIEYKHCLFDRKSPVVFGHHVSTDAGTGLVHIAPGFGEDDFIISKTENIPLIMHVDDKGYLNEEAHQYKGEFYQDANKSIGMDIDKKGQLLSLKFIKHSYPHDWRTHKPVMYRATPQWFVSIEKIKSKIINALGEVSTYPNWAKDRMIKMIQDRQDWCISRQRTWGVPITIFYDSNNSPVFDEKVFDYVIDLISKNGIDIWYSWETDKLLPEEYRNKGFTKEKDIMDVWFDSGSSHMAAFADEKKEGPYDIYLEGSDQFRGWFNSSLITSVAWNGKSPYKNLISHGFVLDGKGQKMSKSKGNIINPFSIIQKSGIDILRLWVANSEYSNDVNISQDIINQSSELFRKIRNSMKFMDGNLFDYDVNKKIELEGIHLFFDEKINKLNNKIIKYYNEYSFLKVIKEINNFLVFASTIYFEISKDILYTYSKDDKERVQVQSNIYKLFNILLIALSPIIPVTTEDLYLNSNLEKKYESIHESPFLNEIEIKTNEEDKWKEFFEIKDRIYKLIEDSKKDKVLSRSNEAYVGVNTSSEFIKSLDLKRLLIVGKVEFTNEDEFAKTFDSKKCDRCWNHFEDKNMGKNDICLNCEKVVNSLK